MLTASVAVSATFVLVTGSGWAADPAPAPVTVVGDPKGGAITTDVTAPGAAPSAETDSVHHVAESTAGPVCTWTELSTHSTELLLSLGLGEAGGRFYDVRCSDGSVTPAIYVPPAAQNVPPEIVVAGTLARQATNRLPLPTPAAQRNPSADALVGLDTWWWIDPAQWRPLTQRTQAGPVWAEVIARPVRAVWDAGDGSSPVVCLGPGQPYDPQRPSREQSTDCSHTYARSSASQPQTGPDVNDRFFTVTVTVFWQVTWSGSGGAGGQLPEISRSHSFPLRVQERQTVVTGGSG